MTKYNLVMTLTPGRVAGGIFYMNPTYMNAPVHLLTYSLTYLHRIAGVLCEWPVVWFRDFSANDLSYVPLPLIGPKIINERC